MKDLIRDFGITALLVLALVVGSCLHGCVPGPAARTDPPRVGVDASALYTLVRQETHPRATWGTGDDTPTWTGLAPRWMAYCHAFGVRRLGRAQLATAAHCVAGAGTFRYQRPWGLGTAHVSYVSEARDVAYLDTDEPVRTLERGEPPPLGTHVRVFSTFGSNSGLVTDQYVLGMYEASLTIRRGWSGSPVVDAYGRAVGVVVKCVTDDTGAECAPGHAIVAALP